MCVSDGEVEVFKVLIEMSVPIYCYTDGSVSVRRLILILSEEQREDRNKERDRHFGMRNG